MGWGVLIQYAGLGLHMLMCGELFCFCLGGDGDGDGRDTEGWESPLEVEGWIWKARDLNVM